MKKGIVLLLSIFCLLQLNAQMNVNVDKAKSDVSRFLKKKVKVSVNTYFTPQRSPGGLAYDAKDEHLYAYGVNSLIIHRYETNGNLGPGESIPYETVYTSAIDSYKFPAKTSALGLDVTTESFTLGEKKIPANCILIFNGVEKTREITAVDKYTGEVIGGLDIGNGRYVGGVYSPQRNTIFLIESASNNIIEIETRKGKVLNTFSINVNGQRQLNIFGGAIEINDKSKTIFVATDGPTVIREFSFDGKFIKDYELDGLLEKPALVQAINGLAFDEDNNLWLGTTGGRRMVQLTNIVKK
ncbi:MAG: hypothetical protein AAFO07_01545 [Bacteroidota bacterium]